MSWLYTAHPKHLHRIYRPPHSRHEDSPSLDHQPAKPSTQHQTDDSTDEEDDDDLDSIDEQDNNLHQILNFEVETLPETPPTSHEAVIPVIDPSSSDNNLSVSSPLPEMEPTSDQICLQHEEPEESDDTITDLDYQYDTDDLIQFHT